jgi:hypothetical protein
MMAKRKGESDYKIAAKQIATASMKRNHLRRNHSLSKSGPQIQPLDAGRWKVEDKVG